VDARKLARTYLGGVGVRGDFNEYRIQERCTEFAEQELLAILAPDERAFLEMISYQEGIDISKVMRVIGIEMRDLFLEQRTKQAC
jgi:hypothetical protein